MATNYSQHTLVFEIHLRKDALAQAADDQDFREALHIILLHELDCQLEEALTPEEIQKVLDGVE